MAGATRMRTRTFFLVATIGTLAKVTIVYYLGDVLSTPLKDVADFVGKYQWYLTPVTFVLVAVQLWKRRRKDRLPIETIDDFEHDLRDDLEEAPEQAVTESTSAS